MSQRGFSLLEVLVAFSILALSLGVLMRIFSGALTNTAVSREQTEALVLAQSLIASAGVEMPFGEGVATGRQGPQLEWQLEMNRFDPGLNMTGTGTSSLTLWEIKARVAWHEHSGTPERVVSLSTLRAGREGGP